MKKRKRVLKLNKILCILTIIIMLGTFFDVVPLMKPITVSAAPTPVEEDEVFYQNADFFDYNRWDWNIANYYDAWFYIQIEQPKYPLRLAVNDDNNVYLADKEDGAMSQMWHFHYNDEYNSFIVENVGTGRVLHRIDANKGENVNVDVNVEDSAKNSINRNWKILSNKDNTFRLVAANNSSLVLDAEGSDSSDPQGNSNVHLWTDAGTNNQKWSLIPVSEGTYASALLYRPNPASYTGEADYNNVKQTTGIVKDTLSGSWSSPDFSSPISNNFALFYDSNYSKYSDTGAYNGYADFGGLKPYENVALRKYQMPYLICNNGWYEFDSNNYYVVKDNSQKKFLLYNRAVSGNVQQVVSDGKFKEGFFPFNGQGVSEANYGIGMRTELKFTYVDDGYVNYIDQNDESKSQAMEFKFSGDDDLWVFVDGKLVLDVGGIHGRTEGSINFATKKSYMGGEEQTDFSSFFNTSTREHFLNIFYLERCPYESNLKITFNLLMEHKLTYHSNDGTNKSKEENYINEPRIDIKDNMFDVREGYVFKGWNTKADGSGSSVSPNTKLLLQKDINLYAQWEKKEDVVYKITLDGNGGNLDTTASFNKDTTKNHKIYANITKNSYHIYTYDTYIQIHKNNATESSYKAQREGYEFTGFYTEKTGGRQIISSSGEIIVDANTFTEDTTVYAQWTASDNTKYVVNHWKQKLYCDGTTKYTDSSVHNKVNYNLADSQVFTNGVTGSKVTPERKNYDGFTSPLGIEVTIKSDGSTVVDYYYIRNSYTLTVKPNGSTWNDSTENRSYTLRYEEEMNIPNPSRTGYIFKKWIMTPTDKGSTLTDKGSASKTFKMGYENTILTVTMGKGDDGDNDESWQPIKYTITYDRNTPADSLSATGGETPDSQHIYDVSSKLSENGFTLEGYTFAGWKLYNSGQMYGNSQNKGAVDVLNLTNVDGRVLKMYAQWTPIENIKYVVNHWKQKLYYDGTRDYTDSAIHDENNYSLSDTGTFVGIADSKVTPKVEQYTGFTSPSSIEVKIKGDGSTVVNYYYTRNEYDVGEDDGNGGLHLICGTGIERTSGAGRYKYGETVSIDADVKDGYTWYQWTGTMQADKKDYMFYMPAYNVTLTANATPNQYKIYFDGNKLEYSLYSDLTLKTTEKEVTFMQPLGELPVPELKGARFDGWYTTRFYDGEQWTEDTLYPKVGTKMLYARWTDITEPECDMEDSYICPFDGTSISFNCKDEGGSGLKAIHLYKGTEVKPENIVTDDTLSVDIVNEEGNCYGILANQFKADPDGDNYYTLEIIDNAGNTTTKVFELICGEPLTWQSKLWRLNKSFVMAGTSDALVYWTDSINYPRKYGDLTGFIQTDIEGHVDKIEYDFVDERIPDIVTEIENAHENDTYTDNVQFTLPKDAPGYASYVKVKVYRNVGTSHETVDVRNLNFKIEKYDFSRVRTRIRVTSGMYIPEDEKGHVLPHSPA